MFDFKLEIEATDNFRNYVRYILNRGKNKLEENAPIAYVNIAEQIDVWGNKFVVVAKNIPLDLYHETKNWIASVRRVIC